MNEHVDYVAPKASWTTRFLWWCAGADPLILRQSSYSDHVKYQGIGGVVLATAILAFISMVFAIYTIFDHLIVALVIGFVWSLIILNLDRFIVSSTGKGDGDATISGKEFINALPRLLMAIALGITISAPLETVLFKTEILREWEYTRNQLALIRRNEVKAELALTGEVQETKTKIDSASARVQKYEAILAESNTMIQNLVNGIGVPRCTGGPTCSTLAHRELYKQNDEAKVTVSEAKEELERLKNELKGFEEAAVTRINDAANEILTKEPGFLDQLMMLEKLSSHEKELLEYDPVTFLPKENGKKEVIYGKAGWPVWMVRILFILIEIAPIFFKLMLIKGPYDYMSENVAQILETKQGISIHHLPDEYSKVHKLKENHNPRRIIAVVEHQNRREEENALAAIDAFADKEKAEIQANPEKFIQQSRPENPG